MDIALVSLCEFESFVIDFAAFVICIIGLLREALTWNILEIHVENSFPLANVQKFSVDF